MSTVTIDILNIEAMKLLQDLQDRQLIRLHKVKTIGSNVIDWKNKYKGAITQQSIIDVDKQLNQLRNEWE